MLDSSRELIVTCYQPCSTESNCLLIKFSQLATASYCLIIKFSHLATASNCLLIKFSQLALHFLIKCKKMSNIQRRLTFGEIIKSSC